MKKNLLMALFFCPILLATAGEWKFDCGPAQEPAASGWQRLGEKDLFGNGRTFGWVAHWGYGYKTPGQAELGTAIGAQHHKIDGVFKMQLPNGVYKVTVAIGSNQPGECRDGQCVAINNRVVLPPPGVGGWNQYSVKEFPAVVDNGLLTVRFFTPGTKGTQRLNVLSLKIATASDSEKAALQKAFTAAPLQK